MFTCIIEENPFEKWAEQAINMIICGRPIGRPYIFTRKITNLQGCPLSIRIYIFFGKSVFPQ